MISTSEFCLWGIFSLLRRKATWNILDWGYHIHTHTCIDSCECVHAHTQVHVCTYTPIPSIWKLYSYHSHSVIDEGKCWDLDCSFCLLNRTILYSWMSCQICWWHCLKFTIGHMFQFNLRNRKAYSGQWYSAYLSLPPGLSVFLKCQCYRQSTLIRTSTRLWANAANC